MQRFAFTGRDSSGREVSGYREAVSAASLAQELSSGGTTPLAIKPAEEHDAALADSDTGRWRLFEARVSIDEVILFSHQMHSLAKAGISVVAALHGLAESQSNPKFREVLLDISGHLESGADIATSLRHHPKVFSELYASVIHVGENTGRLDQGFKQIALNLEIERETLKRIKAATRYPLFVLGAISIAIVIMNMFVIPAFADVFAKFNAQLPWQTRAIIAVSDFFVDYWIALAVGFCGGTYALRRYLDTPAGRFKWDYWKLKLPIVGGIFERVHLGRFCQTFAMVSSAGVPITQGLNVISRAIGNEYMADRVSGMRVGIERGSSVIQTARESGMFTPVVLQMIAVGEETGAMDTLLAQAAGFYEEEVDYQLKTLTDAVEPLLIIAIGVLVLILALGVFLPLWDLSSIAT